MVRFAQFIGSRAFAVFLLVLSTAMLLVWRGEPGYFSRAFLVVPAVLFVSILVCMARRFSDSGGVERPVFWGSFMLHAGILVVIASGAAGAMTRFLSVMVLPQGVIVSMEDSSRAKVMVVPAGGADKPSIFMKLYWHETFYENDIFPVRQVAHVNVAVAKGGEYMQDDVAIGINEPLRRWGYQFMLGRIRHIPLFTMQDGDKSIFSKYVDVPEEVTEEGMFEIPEEGLTVYTRFFPDVYNEGRSYGTRSAVVRNPAFGIRIVRTGDALAEIWKGVLKPGEEAKVGGKTFTFVELKQTAIVQISDDSSYWGILAGWLLVVAGLIVRYGFVLRSADGLEGGKG